MIVTVDSNFIDKDEKAGPFDVSDPRYGCFDPEIYKDDNQANFTFNFSEVLVYTWQLWDKYDMIYFKQYLFVWIVLKWLWLIITTTATQTPTITTLRTSIVLVMVLVVNGRLLQSIAELSKAIRQEQVQVVQYQLQHCNLTDGNPQLNILNVCYFCFTCLVILSTQ